MVCGTLACIGTQSGMSSRAELGRFHSTSSAILITARATLRGRAIGSRVQKRLGTMIMGFIVFLGECMICAQYPHEKLVNDEGWCSNDPLWVLEHRYENCWHRHSHLVYPHSALVPGHASYRAKHRHLLYFVDSLLYYAR